MIRKLICYIHTRMYARAEERQEFVIGCLSEENKSNKYCPLRLSQFNENSLVKRDHLF